MNSTVAISAEDLLVSHLKWPAGAPAGLPTNLVISVPEYLLDSADDDELEEYISDAICDQVGTAPLNTFSFEPA
jgi:hypothetical protein